MLNSLENYVSTKKFNNPFIQGGINKPDSDIYPEEEISIQTLYKYYQTVYLLLPLKHLDAQLMNFVLDEDTLFRLQKSLIIVPKKIKMMRIPILYEWGRTINKKFIEKCHLGSITYESLSEKILVLPMFTFPYDQMSPFIELFKNKDWLNELILNFKLAEYFKISSNYAELRNQLEYTPITHWSKENNCKINSSNRFQMRFFRWQLYHSNSDKLKTLDELKKYNVKDDNYLSIFFKTHGNLDSKFTPINFKLHKLPKVINTFTNDQFNKFMLSLKNKERFNLFNTILVSPEYCSLIMKNEIIWDIMKPMINNSLPLYRYLLFYTYLTLYLQENIKKTYLRQTDSSIIPINVASKLPNFPYLQSDRNSHPAISAGQLINESLYTSKNFYGLSCATNNKINSDELKLSNFEEFQERLNIFMTGNSYNNIFINVDFTNIHLTGSLISACGLKKHPLVHNFVLKSTDNNDTKNALYHRYFSEFYYNSDVDVLFTINNPFKFYDKVQEFKTQVESGMNLYENSNFVILTQKIIRKGYFRFNYAFVVKTLLPYWKDKGLNKTIKEIFTTLDDIETKKLFMSFYNQKIKSFYKEIQEEYTSKEKKELKINYPHIFEPIDINLIILDHYEDVNNKKMKVEDMEFSNEEKEYTGEPYFDARESYKYNLYHPILNHHFECFSVPFEDPWSCINKFHLGQVRGYYNGSNVYYTISAVMALQTKLSPDYRIMFGSKDPGEILNKYRMRGFGCILNDKELSEIMKYSEKIEFWKKLYMIDCKNNNSLLNFSDGLFLNSSLFQPRKLNPDSFENSKLIQIPTYSAPQCIYIKTKNNLISDLTRTYNPNKSKLISIFFDCNNISDKGYPVPLKKWLMDGAWEIFEMNKLFTF